MLADSYSPTPKELAMAQLQLFLPRAVLRAIQALDFARSQRPERRPERMRLPRTLSMPRRRAAPPRGPSDLDSLKDVASCHAPECPMFPDADHREKFQPVTEAPRSLHFSPIHTRPLH